MQILGLLTAIVPLFHITHETNHLKSNLNVSDAGLNGQALISKIVTSIPLQLSDKKGIGIFLLCFHWHSFSQRGQEISM